MNVYSLALFEGHLTTSGADLVLWTVPSGFVDVMRCIDGYAGAAGATVAQLRTPSEYFLTLESPAAVTPVHWEGRQAFEEGTVVSVQLSGQPWNLRISGYRLAM